MTPSTSHKSPKGSRHSGGQDDGSDRAGRDPETTSASMRRPASGGVLVEDLAGGCASVAEGD